MDRFDAMTAFVRVAELRGFAPAARRLGVSPSAVTRLVAALEERLATRLLHRTTRAVALTDAGARYLENARRILSAVDDAEQALRSARAVPSGRFVVAAPNLFGTQHVAPLMCAFLQRYPAVTGELTLSDRNAQLVDEAVDVAVRIGALQDSSLRVRSVGKTRRVVVASPAYLASHPRIRSPADLAGHGLVQLMPLDPTPEWSFPRAGAVQRVSFEPSFVTNSADAAIGHAVRGGGLARVLAYQVVERVRRRELAVVLQKHEPPVLPIQLVHPASRLPSASLKAFVELTVRTCRWDFVSL